MFTEVVISGAIAFTMPIFSDKVFDVAIEKKERHESDGNVLIIGRDSEVHRKNQLNRFVYRITIAIIGLILSAYITTPATRWGVGFGSLIILMSGLYGYWGNMNDMYRLIVLAIALIVSVMLSIKLYDVGSISELLKNPFGKISA